MNECNSKECMTMGEKEPVLQGFGIYYLEFTLYEGDPKAAFDMLERNLDDCFENRFRLKRRHLIKSIHQENLR